MSRRPGILSFFLVASSLTLPVTASSSVPLPVRFGSPEESGAWKAGIASRPQPAASAEGPFPMSSRSVSLTLDAFGSFGSSTAGSDATFDEGEQSAGTVFEAMAHVAGVGFLDGEALLLPQSAAGARRDRDGIRAEYALGSFRFTVLSELLDCDAGHCAVLRQRWTVTNLAAEPVPLVFTSYLDGDLQFSGRFENDRGARRGDELFQFDEGSDPGAPSTYLGLASEAPDALVTRREVGEYSDQRRRIASGVGVWDRLVRASGEPADADGDGVADAPFDVSLAVAHEFGDLAPGASVGVTVEIRWGRGDLDPVEPLVADAGPDRQVDCAGPLGTPVPLDGRGSSPLERLRDILWTVDGQELGGGLERWVDLEPGEHEVVLTLTDDLARVAEDRALVVVADATPPEVVVGPPLVLWPPDHRLVPVVLPVEARDLCDPAPLVRVRAVMSDEPEEVREGGDGRTTADALSTDDGRLLLRRERRGDGDGRVYRIFGDVVDASGNVTAFSVEVHVPHDRSRPSVASGSWHGVLR